MHRSAPSGESYRLITTLRNESAITITWLRGIILGVFLGFFACIGTFFIGPSSPPKVIKDQLRDHNPEYQLAYRDKGGELTKKAKRNSYLGASLLLGLLNVFAWLLFPIPQ